MSNLILTEKMGINLREYKFYKIIQKMLSEINSEYILVNNGLSLLIVVSDTIGCKREFKTIDDTFYFVYDIYYQYKEEQKTKNL